MDIRADEIEVDIRHSGDVVFINNDIYDKAEILKMAQKFSDIANELINSLSHRDIKDY